MSKRLLPTIIQNLDDLPTTNQGIFDHAVKHMTAQGWKQCMNGGACAYRDGNGRACALGAFIPSSTRSEEGEGPMRMEGVISDLLTIEETSKYSQSSRLKPGRLRDWMTENNDLLGDLQFAHDQSGDFFGLEPGDLQASFEQVGIKYDLNLDLFNELTK